MELLVVETDRVYPDESNPRRDFSGTEEMAEGFWLNRERPGEPFQPPLLVRDGDAYRIYDGERRWRAIRHNGLEQFTANVCDGYEEADAIVAMLATDDKRALTGVEASRGVQRAMLLGVEPEKVERAARIGRGSAAKVKRAMELAGGECEEMSLDRMYAVAEFDGDEEAVSEIMACGERDWEVTAARIRRRRANEAIAAALRAKADELGIELMADTDAMGTRGYSYDWRLTAETAEKLEESHAACPDALFAISANGTRVYGYRPLEAGGDESKSAEEVELDRRADELAAAFERAIGDVRTWFCANVTAKDPLPLANTRAIVEDCFREVVGYDALAEDCPMLADDGTRSAVDLAIGLECAFPARRISPSLGRKVLADMDDWETRDMLDIGEFFNAALLDGFAFDDETECVKDALEAYLAGGGE